MKHITWDYTKLADFYLSRPPYAATVIDEVVRISDVKPGDQCCDIGAGTGNLTMPLLERGLWVDAVEPNDTMRRHGMQRTRVFDEKVQWRNTQGEATNLPENTYALVTFGSSFNVMDRSKALIETSRLLRKDGWFLCLWNHRDLTEPLQLEVEAAIRRHIPDYSYGTRRQDQAEIINTSGLFKTPILLEAEVSYTLSTDVWINAWRSHATLVHQAGEMLESIIDDIERIVRSNVGVHVTVPYITRGWIARVRGVRK